MNVNAYFGFMMQVVIAYKRYLKDMVQLLGATSTDASSFAEEMFHFEKRIAEITPSLDELQDPATTYNRITLDALKSYAQSVSWPNLFMRRRGQCVRPLAANAIQNKFAIVPLTRQFVLWRFFFNACVLSCRFHCCKF
jgi:predicted metalloendopeptidase